MKAWNEKGMNGEEKEEQRVAKNDSREERERD